MPGFRTALFDLDGTLIDSLSDIAWSANHVLVQEGFPVHERHEYLWFVGQGVRQLFRRALPADRVTDEQVARCCDAFQQVYAEHWNVETQPYEGIRPLLRELRERDVSLAVLSNKPHAATVRCVQAFFPDAGFAAVLGQRDGVPRKPDPSAALEIAEACGVPPEACLVLGDSATDIQTALAAGMYPVGALWGFRPKAELVDAGARGLVAEPAELLRYFVSGRADGV